MQVDPLVFFDHSITHYAYARNNPSNLNGPLGDLVDPKPRPRWIAPTSKDPGHYENLPDDNFDGLEGTVVSDENGLPPGMLCHG